MSVEKPEVGDVWEHKLHKSLIHITEVGENYIGFIGVSFTTWPNGLCDEYHRIATINVKEVLNQQLEIEQLKQRIEFAKQAIDLFFKTEDESKLLEIAEWD